MVQTGETVDVERHSARQAVQMGATERGEVVVVAVAVAMVVVAVAMVVAMAMVVVVVVSTHIRSTDSILEGQGSRSRCHRVRPTRIHRALNKSHTVSGILNPTGIWGRTGPTRVLQESRRRGSSMRGEAT